MTSRHHLSADGLELTVEVDQPDGMVRVLTVTRSAQVGPFTGDDIAQVIAGAQRVDRITPGATRLTRRLSRNVMVHIATGPPTWWLPRLEVTRHDVRRMPDPQRRTRQGPGWLVG